MPPKVVLDFILYTWESTGREGSWVVEHSGTFHLMYSGYATHSTCYAVDIATGSDPLGPFTRRADNPFLHDDPSVGFWGPGHQSVVQGAHDDLLMFLPY